MHLAPNRRHFAVMHRAAPFGHDGHCHDMPTPFAQGLFSSLPITLSVSPAAMASLSAEKRINRKSSNESLCPAVRSCAAARRR